MSKILKKYQNASDFVLKNSKNVRKNNILIIFSKKRKILTKNMFI